jgi:CSLREA domain-containing protein
MRTRTRSIFNRFTVFAALTALIVSVVYVTPAYAAGIVVNMAGDTVNANDGLCSLREAITAANSNTASGPGAGECAAGSGVDTISFAGNYTITLSPGERQLPVVTSPVIINGRGATNTIIQGHTSPNAATMRVFFVDFGGNLTLNRVTVRHGRCTNSFPDFCLEQPASGGGIYNRGTLAVTNSVVTANLTSSMGGGIYSTGTLTVTNSTISGNSANGSSSNLGGGIYNSGTLTVRNSTFSGNTTPGLGGGISSTGTLTITRSTFSGNSALHGGGYSLTSTSTIAKVSNSTFSGNSADSAGGGIYDANQNISNVTNSTFSGNSAVSSGGGIYKAIGTGTITLKNTIVANSTAGENCAGIFTNGGNNLDSGASCGWGSNNGSLSNTNPKLGPLANNGGRTKTRALLPGSPAIDAGADAGCPATDQRGRPRPQGAHCDIGAYEAPSVTTLRSGGAQDGGVLESSENSNQGGAVNATRVVFTLGDDANNRQFRSILHFNTSSLPDNALVTRVILKIRRDSVFGTDPFTTHGKIAVDIRSGAFSNNVVLQVTDFQAAASQPAIGFFTNNPLAGGWYSTKLTAAAYPSINRTGVTQLRLRFQTDDNNDFLADYILFHSGNAVAANRPVLVIEYYVP